MGFQQQPGAEIPPPWAAEVVSQEAKQWGRPWWKKKRFVIPLGLFVLLVIGGALAGDPDEEQPIDTANAPTTTVTNEEATTTSQEATTTSAAITSTTDSTTTTTEAPADPLDLLADEWSDDVERVETISLESGDLRATVFIDTPIFAVGDIVLSEVADVVQDVSKSTAEVDQFVLSVEMELIDQLGNAEQETVLVTTWEDETMSAINWDNFLTSNILSVGETSFIHPALAGELDG